MRQTRVNQTEIKKRYYFRLADGAEFISNDEELKIILTRTRVFSGQTDSDFYSIHYYVKEGTGWQKSNSSRSVTTIATMIKELRTVDDFTKAIADYESFNQ